MSERTKCSCDLCQAGCRTMPGYLVPKDLPFFDLRDLRASTGARVIKDGMVFDIPTLVPAQKDNGECVFYRDGLCDVHEHAPYGCRMFSACQTVEDPDDTRKRHHGVLACLRDHERGGEYARATREVHPARPRNERTEAFSNLLDELESQRTRKP